MDAVQISDNKFVVLKRTSRAKNPFETEILNQFSSGALADDGKNHCVPVLRVLDVPQEEDTIIIVMPLLRKYNDPGFETIREGVDCIRQLFEVASFCPLVAASPVASFFDLSTRRACSSCIRIEWLTGTPISPLRC
jgi:hypothetical protein